MDQVQIEMALDKNYLVPDEIQKAYLMVKLTAPELVGTKSQNKTYPLSSTAVEVCTGINLIIQRRQLPLPSDI